MTFKALCRLVVGGKQIIVENPSGNPVELFQPTAPEARMGAKP